MRRGSGCALAPLDFRCVTTSLQSAVVSSVSVQALISRSEAAIRFRKPQNHVLIICYCLVFSGLWWRSTSQTFPYVSFMGQTLADHSYVDLSLVGDDLSGSDSVQCHTDLNTCCGGGQGSHRGDWYFPNGNRLQFSADILEVRGDQRVDLRRRNSATSPVGIYHCEIATIAVHHDTDISLRATVYVGLYTTSGGRWIIIVRAVSRAS